MFLAEPLGYLPQAALAAVLIFSAFGLLDLRASWDLRAIDRFEFRLSVLTTVGVLTIGVLPGVVLAILLALFNVLAKIYKPQDVVLGRGPAWTATTISGSIRGPRPSPARSSIASKDRCCSSTPSILSPGCGRCVARPRRGRAGSY